MVDLLTVLSIVAFGVGGAELTRHACRRRLSSPVPVRPAAPTVADLVD